MFQEPSTPPIRPEDYIHFNFLHSAKFSPDGVKIVYTLSSIIRDNQNKEVEFISLWILFLKTGEHQKLSTEQCQDTSPIWSPDGESIAFLSDRSGTTQIHTIPYKGGVAQPVTTINQNVSGTLHWSSDGQNIAFTAGPLQQTEKEILHRIDRDIYRFDGIGYTDQVFRDIHIISLVRGEVIRLTKNESYNTIMGWSPDDSKILFKAALPPKNYSGFLGSLKTVDLEGTIEDLTGDWGLIKSAAWMPNGSSVLRTENSNKKQDIYCYPHGVAGKARFSIVFCGKPKERKNGSKCDLWKIEIGNKDFICLTENLENGVGGTLEFDMNALSENVMPNLWVSNDGKFAYIQAQNRGSVSIGQVGLQNKGLYHSLIDGDRACFLMDANTDYLLYAVSTIHEPPDLFLSKMDGSDEKRLTQLNITVLSQKAVPSVEHLSYKSSDDVEIEGWVLLPPYGEPPYPTIVYIHGGPHIAYGNIFSFDFQMLAGAGFAVLFLNHRGSTGYGDTFANQTIGDWGNLDYQDVIAGVDVAIEKGFSDPNQLGCCGGSGGGYLTCWIIGHPHRFKAAVPENPCTNWVSIYGTSDIGPYFSVREL